MEDIIDCIDMVETTEGSSIMVVGVGGGGGNAVKYMYDLGIHNVMFAICNTDSQALVKSPVPHKMQLGKDLTKGRGAGNKPEKGRAAAFESRDEIREMLCAGNVEMVFITAGMGGGTGTGAAPVIAEIAREMEILTVAIVTVPFLSEGPLRLNQAAKGIDDLRKHVDALLIIDNESINSMYGDLSFSEAFGKSDDVLATAAKGIAEIITRNLTVNVDFEDVKETMSNSGVALMGFAMEPIGEDNIATRLTEEALKSPLLNQNNIYGAKKILVKVAWKDIELKMKVVYDIIEHIQAGAGSQASLIWGAGYDETVEDGHASVVVIATGFDSKTNDKEIENYISRIEVSNNTAPNPVSTKKQTPSPSPKQPIVVSLDNEETEKDLQEVLSDEDDDDDDDEFFIVSTAPTTPQSAAPKKEFTRTPQREILSLEDDEVEEKVKHTIEEDPDMQIVATSTSRQDSLFEDGTFDDEDIESNPDAIKQHIDNIITEGSSRTITGGSSKIFNQNKQYTYDELEQLPAYIRRRVTLGKHSGEKQRKVIHTFKKDE